MIPRSGWRRTISLALATSAVLLLGASLGALAWATSSLAARESRRSDARVDLERANRALAEAAAAGLAIVPTWPDYLDADSWTELDRWLVGKAREVLDPMPGIDGGYYITSDGLYLGYAPRDSPAPPTQGIDPPRREYDLVDQQVREALDEERPAIALVDGPGGAVVVRAVPVRVNGRKVAATWAIFRLDEAGVVDQALGRYRLASGLALGGITLALILAVTQSRTVRRQAGERERLQAELRRSERLAALGKLLAGVAHEVRNPLAGIRSTVQLWQRGVPPDSEAIADVIAEVDRLDELVAHLLRFSRADGSDLRPDDLNEVVAEAARLARPRADEQGVAVELATDGAIPPVPMSSPALLQLFRNLTTNALQVMPEGGTLRLSTRLDPGRGRIVAEVIDTGPGLGAEAARHLFEPFFTTRPEGTGLGLAIAREIALAHRGDLLAANRDDRSGAIFRLSLPIQHPAT
ncbi:MAG: histidine kinase dimerization/phospho-acceptor domain-containing protein [Isosphaeraceae bacterium]